MMSVFVLVAAATTNSSGGGDDWERRQRRLTATTETIGGEVASKKRERENGEREIGGTMNSSNFSYVFGQNQSNFSPKRHNLLDLVDPGDMVLQCYTWLLHLFKQIMGAHADDKKWLRLTSSPSSSSCRDKTLILHYFCSSGYLRISVIGGKSEKECKIGGLKSITMAHFKGCCNGLALFYSFFPSFLHIVVNPLSKEMETIYGPFRGGESCGFFFHPVAKEFRILNVRKVETNKYEYHIYLSGAKIWRRIATPYFSRIPTHSRNMRHKDIIDYPAIVNDALHWYMDEIMVFDIITEEFSIRPPPLKGSAHMRNLYAKDDQLCFCSVSFKEPLMDIWVLEDYAKWRWDRKYTINLDWDMNKYPMETSFLSLACIMDDVRVISIKNNELVLFWKHRGLFSYHLKFNTVEKLCLRKYGIEVVNGGIDYCYDWTCGFEGL